MEGGILSGLQKLGRLSHQRKAMLRDYQQI